MKKILTLNNTIQDYAWGSTTAIPELMGLAPTGLPQAELWMGAHPKAPSRVREAAGEISLIDWIGRQPEETLGKPAAERFHNQLPFLFKVLAAAEPLSIQAHPSREAAREGFERENRQEIPLNVPHRNYKDPNHKPECICALTAFWALSGFRRISDIIGLGRKLCPDALRAEWNDLETTSNPDGLKRFFRYLMTLTEDRRTGVIQETVANAAAQQDDNPICRWILTLHNAYPEDIGVLSPMLLNLVCLEPGHAMFLPAGRLHSYLDGVGIELMANSDNVLRGGLTPKHIDVPELLNRLDFENREVRILRPEKKDDHEWVYLTPAEEFILSVISIRDEPAAEFTAESIQVLLCTEGEVVFTLPQTDQRLEITKGMSVVVPAAVGSYRISGRGRLYKASIPLETR